MSGKKWSISARIDNELHRTFSIVQTRFGVSETKIITDAVAALCDYAIDRGKYERPMKMIFDEEQANFMGLVAEPPGAATDAVVQAALEKKEKKGGGAKGAGNAEAGGRS